MCMRMRANAWACGRMGHRAFSVTPVFDAYVALDLGSALAALFGLVFVVCCLCCRYCNRAAAAAAETEAP